MIAYPPARAFFVFKVPAAVKTKSYRVAGNFFVDAIESNPPFGNP